MARRLLPKRPLSRSHGHLAGLSRLDSHLSERADDLEIVEIPFDDRTGAIDIGALNAVANDELLCLVIGYPNAFGVIEPLGAAAETAHRAGALVVTATAEALALGLLKPPGELGADIVAGEGQSFGLPVQFGGPGVGFLATRIGQVRQMPGRLVGQTRDRDGRRAFCLTLSTREQHIRRERATSNICTNHSLCALAATVYLSLMGRVGLRELAERNVELAHQTADALESRGLSRRFNGPYFNEFAIALPHSETALAWAEQRRMLAGVPLAQQYPELKDCILVSVTEMNRSAELTMLADVLAEAR